MKLGRAKLCADFECGEIYTDKTCPACGSAEFVYLAKLLNREEKEANACHLDCCLQKTVTIEEV